MYNKFRIFSWLTSGIELFSTGLGDIYYPSNELDPYLKDNDVSLIPSGMAFCCLFALWFQNNIFFLSFFSGRGL
jgi:hypothetical protein